MRREGCPKRERESFGDIYDVENYRGPWADFAERHASAAPAILADRIVSKQNMQPGNEVCKMEKTTLHRYFSPIPAKPFAFPTARTLFSYHKGGISSLRFFKRYDFLLSGSLDGRVVLHRDRPLRMFMGHSRGISGVGLSFDEMSLTTASYDGWVKRWDVERGRCVARWDAREPITACEVHDCVSAVGGSGGTLGLIDARCKEPAYSIGSPGGGVLSVALSASMIGLVRADGSVEFRELDGGRLSHAIRGGYRQIVADSTPGVFVAHSRHAVHALKDGQITECWPSQDTIACLGLQPDGKDIVYGSSSAELVFVRRNGIIKISGHKVACLDVSRRDNKSIAIGFADGTIEAWK